MTRFVERELRAFLDCGGLARVEAPEAFVELLRGGTVGTTIVRVVD